MTTLRLASTAAASVDADAIVIGVGPHSAAAPMRGRRRRNAPSASAPVEVVGGEGAADAFEGSLAGAVATLGGTGKAGEITRLPSSGRFRAPLIVAVGLGESKDGGYDAEVLRRAAGSALRSLAGTARVAVALPAGDASAVGAVCEGALLGAYAFLRFRVSSLEATKPPAEIITVLTSLAKDKAAKAASARALTVATATNLVRDLVNTPPGHLAPADLAAAALAAVDGLPVDTSVLDEKELRSGGYGGLTGVGQGSVNPPRLVRLAYRPLGAKTHLALVGKGITFDSGGLSLKPPAAMEWMKSDMGGAAAVIAAMAAIARLGLPISVTAYAACAENLPSGTAMRPSDVITIYGGRTVEVLNTDAEGRLVLADALVAACEDKPDVVIDVATLTGAQVVALGARTAGIMSNDEGLRGGIHRAATAAGEAMWPMPLPEELRASMDSDVADIANMGDKFGGMLVGGLFLRDFVSEGVKWAHLDIAGPSFNQSAAFGYTPKGGTGCGVRTLVRVAEDMAAGTLLSG